jgi:hypothetical protein
LPGFLDMLVSVARVIEHDPEKCAAVFLKRSCSNNEIKRDDESKKSHRA